MVKPVDTRAEAVWGLTSSADASRYVTNRQTNDDLGIQALTDSFDSE
jgi:hypothetical protein